MTKSCDNFNKLVQISFHKGNTSHDPYRSYVKLANDLRKYYLKREMENSKTRCLTVDKLMDINEKFGSASELQLSLELDPQQMRKRMIEVLSDPFERKQKVRSSFTSVHEDRLFAHEDFFTSQNIGSSGFNA